MPELIGRSWIESEAKRREDIAYSLAALPLAAPLVAGGLTLSAIIDRHNPLFRQQRIGQHGTCFDIYKIRSLKGVLPDTVGNGPNDDRATKLGKFLRGTGIDELPQLVNILKGDLSVIGPRIANPSVFEAMQQALQRNTYDEWLEAYYASKPGVVSTYGLSQRYEHIEEAERRFSYKARLDVQDFRNASFRHDHQLLAQTGKTALGVIGRTLR